MKATYKTVTVDYVFFDGSAESAELVHTAFPQFIDGKSVMAPHPRTETVIRYLPNKEVQHIQPNHFIVKKPDGSFAAYTIEAFHQEFDCEEAKPVERKSESIITAEKKSKHTSHTNTHVKK